MATTTITWLQHSYNRSTFVGGCFLFLLLVFIRDTIRILVQLNREQIPKINYHIINTSKIKIVQLKCKKHEKRIAEFIRIYLRCSSL